MTISEIKKIYKDIYDICKKYDGTDMYDNSSSKEYAYSYYTEQKIVVEGSQYNFDVNMSLEANDRALFTDTDYEIYIELIVNEDGITVDYDINTSCIDKDYDVHKDIDSTDIPLEVHCDDEEQTITLSKSNSIENAEIDDVKTIINELYNCLYIDYFYLFTTMSQEKDFEIWQLISELNNYLKSL